MRCTTTPYDVFQTKECVCYITPLQDRHLHKEVNVGPRKVGWKYTANRKMKMIYRPINDNGKWRARYNSEIYMVYNELDTVTVIKTGR